MLVRVQNRRGFGQVSDWDETTRAIFALPSQLPPVMTSLAFQPGFTPVAGQPGAFTVRMAPAGESGVMDWLEANKTVVLIGAGTLALLAMMSSTGRRRR